MNKTVGQMYKDWLQDKNSSSFEVYCYDQGRADERERIIKELEEAKDLVPVNRLLDDIIKDKPKELGMLIAYDKAIEIVRGGENE